MIKQCWLLLLLVLTSCVHKKFEEPSRSDVASDLQLYQTKLENRVLSRSNYRGFMYLSLDDSNTYFMFLAVNDQYDDSVRDAFTFLDSGDLMIKSPSSDSITLVHGGTARRYELLWLNDSLNKAIGHPYRH
jgi:hypothetical protein